MTMTKYKGPKALYPPCGLEDRQVPDGLVNLRYSEATMSPHYAF